MEKVCTKCQKTKNESQYYDDSRNNDGKQSRCKQCFHDDQKLFRDSNVEKVKARKAADYRKDLDKSRKKERDRYHRTKKELLPIKKQKYSDGAYRKSYLKFHFGITPEDYDSMLKEQGEVCGICGVDRPGGAAKINWVVDHDHSCCAGKRSCGRCVRGLLCSKCNLALGLLRDDPKSIENALVWVTK